MRAIYFDKPSGVSNFAAWLFYSWHLNAISRGYERLGQYREIGTRICGICFLWFATKADKDYYEAANATGAAWNKEQK